MLIDIDVDVDVDVVMVVEFIIGKGFDDGSGFVVVMGGVVEVILGLL